MESNCQKAQINNPLPLIHLEHTHNEYFQEDDIKEWICGIPVIPSARFPIAAGISSSTLLPLYDPSHIGETYSKQQPSDEEYEKIRQTIAVSFLY